MMSCQREYAPLPPAHRLLVHALAYTQDKALHVQLHAHAIRLYLDHFKRHDFAKYLHNLSLWTNLRVGVIACRIQPCVDVDLLHSQIDEKRSLELTLSRTHAHSLSLLFSLYR